MPMQLAKKGRAGDRCVSHTIPAAIRYSRTKGARTIPTVPLRSHSSIMVVQSPRSGLR